MIPKTHSAAKTLKYSSDPNWAYWHILPYGHTLLVDKYQKIATSKNFLDHASHDFIRVHMN